MKIDKGLHKFAIQNEAGRFLWGITSRHGVHFENETMPQFWDLNAKTMLFDSEKEANNFAIRHDIRSWTNYNIVPMSFSLVQ